MFSKYLSREEYKKYATDAPPDGFSTDGLPIPIWWAMRALHLPWQLPSGMGSDILALELFQVAAIGKLFPMRRLTANNGIYGIRSALHIQDVPRTNNRPVNVVLSFPK
jgi:hypothetical protein